MRLTHDRRTFSPDDGGAGGTAAAAEPGAAAAAAGAASAGNAEVQAEPTLLGGEVAKTEAEIAAEAKTTADAKAAADKAAADATKTGALANKGKTQEQIDADKKDAEDAAKAAADKAAADAKDDPDVPEGTAFTLKAPDGFEGLDEAALAAAQPILRGLGVKTNGAAQAAVDAFAKEVLPGMLERARQGEQAAIDTSIADTRKEWATAAIADKEYGGSPEKLKANIDLAVRFRDRFGTPELTALLEGTGIGNHPEVVRLFVRAGKAISEGAFHVSDGAAQIKLTPEQKMYGAEFQPKT